MQLQLPLPPEAYRLTDPRGRTVEVCIVRSRRRSWALYVKPDGRVEIRIPMGMPDTEAVARARENATWIFRQLDKTTRKPSVPCPVHFAAGERLSYLGEVYTLRLQPGLPLNVEVREAEQELLLTLPPPVENPVRVRDLLHAWYTDRAKSLFPARVRQCLDRAAAEGFPPVTRLTIRHTKTRWGSCSAQGHVMLSSYLLQAPMDCVDYVVMHELCHLRELNHSPRFYAILTRLMPDWKVHRERLERISTDW